MSDSIVLILSSEEADVLMCVCCKIGGPMDGPRKHMTAIRNYLEVVAGQKLSLTIDNDMKLVDNYPHIVREGTTTLREADE